MNQDSNFMVIDKNEILNSLFEKWMYEPDFNEIHLYQVYQKYQDVWPNQQELTKWKNKLFLEKLKIVTSAQDLSDTLDEMDEINRQLDEFSCLVFSCQEELKYLYDNLENIEKNNYLYSNFLYYPNQYIFPFLKNIYDKIYDLTKKIINLEI